MEKILCAFLAFFAGSLISATHTFNNPSSLMIIAKSLNITISNTAETSCSITIPEGLEACVIPSEANRTIVLQQIALTPKLPDAIAITLPRTCSLSCWLTSNAQVTISNSPESTLAPLSLNLFSGGVISVINGTYTTSNITVHGLGFVELNKVTRQSPATTYLNGIATLLLISADGSFSIGGDMQIHNGARIGAFLRAGPRPQKLPVFPDISLAQLTDYATGKTTHRELPDEWVNTLPGAAFEQTSYDHRLKEIILNLEFQASDELTQNLSSPAISRPETPLSTHHAKGLPLLASHAYETQTFGRNTHGLTFNEIKELLSPNSIYKGRISRKYFSENGISSTHHPHSPITLIKCIDSSTATEQEKETLWNLFLYHEMAFVTSYGYGEATSLNTLYKEYSKSPLRAKIESYFHQNENAGILVVGSFIGLLTSMAIFSTSKKTNLGGGLYKVETDLGNPLKIPLKWNLGCILAGIALMQHASYQPPEDVRPSIVPKIEELISFYGNLLEIVIHEAPSFPKHLANEFADLQKDLTSIIYKKDTAVDYKEFATYLDLIHAYHKDLSKKAGFA